MSTSYDVIVLGGGATGLHAAGALAVGGLRVALVEREPVGGESSRGARLPSRVEGQERRLADDGVGLLRGHGRLAGPCAAAVDGIPYTTEHVVLATGSEPIMPPIRGLRELDGVWTSREATAMNAVPHRLLVIGGGRIGVELAQAVRRLGAEVVLIERSERVLPREPQALGEALGEILRRDGIELVLGVAVSAAGRHGGDYVLELADRRELRGDRLLVATGRRPRVDGIGLETLRMVPDSRGIPVDAYLRAGGGVWAIGGVTGLWPLTHVGRYQAGIVAANILGELRAANYDAVPRVTFTDPQAAAVGAAEDAFSATARLGAGAKPATYGNSYAESDGYLTVLSDGERLTGAHAVGPGAGDWLQQATLAIHARIPLEVLADTIQPFSTFSEVYGWALHELQREIAGSEPARVTS